MRYYYDYESRKANTWFTTREELLAWLLGIFDKPFGCWQPGKLGPRTPEAWQAWGIVSKIREAAPVTVDTDPDAWARAQLTAACLGGMFDDCAPVEVAPIVLRWTVQMLRTGAAIDVQDARDLQEESALDELLQDVSLDGTP